MINQILEGHKNNILNKNEDIYNERMKVCRSCKLYKDDIIFGAVCNKKLYLNPETNETSTTEKEGFTRGCGCSLSAKTRVSEARCPVNKW